MRLSIFSATAKTKSIAVTDSSSSVALPSTGNTIRLVNESAYPCYVSIGDGTQTATVPATTAAATCTPVPAFADLTLSIPDSTSALQIGSVCRTGYSATLLVSVGEGC